MMSRASPRFRSGTTRFWRDTGRYGDSPLPRGGNLRVDFFLERRRHRWCCCGGEGARVFLLLFSSRRASLFQAVSFAWREPPISKSYALQSEHVPLIKSYSTTRDRTLPPPVRRLGFQSHRRSPAPAVAALRRATCHLRGRRRLSSSACCTLRMPPGWPQRASALTERCLPVPNHDAKPVLQTLGVDTRPKDPEAVRDHGPWRGWRRSQASPSTSPQLPSRRCS